MLMGFFLGCRKPGREVYPDMAAFLATIGMGSGL
jgi:hypothetical protein